MSIPAIPNRGAHQKLLLGQAYKLAYRYARTGIAPAPHTIIPRDYAEYLRGLGYSEEVITEALER